MKDNYSSQALSARQARQIRTAQPAPSADIEENHVLRGPSGQRSPDQLKKIVAAQTALRWTKIVKFPNNHTRTQRRNSSAPERTYPNTIK